MSMVQQMLQEIGNFYKKKPLLVGNFTIQYLRQLGLQIIWKKPCLIDNTLSSSFEQFAIECRKFTHPHFYQHCPLQSCESSARCRLPPSCHKTKDQPRRTQSSSLSHQNPSHHRYSECLRIQNPQEKLNLNPLHPNISSHILLTVLHTFFKVLLRRNC